MESNGGPTPGPERSEGPDSSANQHEESGPSLRLRTLA
jgi:hypothetical protein